jgi:hypothetical protein
MIPSKITFQTKFIIKSFLSFFKSLGYNLEDKRLLWKFDNNFDVKEFSFFCESDVNNEMWGNWSRNYEYEFVLRKLEDYGAANNSLIHNSSWGFHGCHILFKDSLEKRYANVFNSDNRFSDIDNTFVLDLKKNIPDELVGRFDFVLNISTLEEIEFSQIWILRNLLRMVKTNGFLILTFDFPGLNIKKFEKLFDLKVHNPPNPLQKDFTSGKGRHYNLQVGYLILQKK